MPTENVKVDRYISFCGIECDANADKLISILNKHLELNNGGDNWVAYFRQKLSEQLKMERDNLHFIGNQINPLFEYFEACDDQFATDLLYQIEQECC